jgi:hypothetical protein
VYSTVPQREGDPIVPLYFFFYNDLVRKASFEQFEATSLYCAQCKSAVPVRKRLLLVLPEGDQYEYLCAYCSASVGTKTEKNAPQIELIIKP